MARSTSNLRAMRNLTASSLDSGDTPCWLVHLLISSRNCLVAWNRDRCSHKTPIIEGSDRKEMKLGFKLDTSSEEVSSTASRNMFQHNSTAWLDIYREVSCAVVWLGKQWEPCEGVCRLHTDSGEQNKYVCSQAATLREGTKENSSAWSSRRKQSNKSKVTNKTEGWQM